MDSKVAAQGIVHDNSEALIALSHRIHADPELCFEEERAAEGTATMLNDAGFTIETGVADLPTAYVATYGSGPLVIGICAEYDALPGVGHACGHNIIASAAMGAGLALAPLADDLGIGALHVKDEGYRLGLGSFKALGGAYAVIRLLLEEAERAFGRRVDIADLQTPEVRAVARKMTFACATDGNQRSIVAPTIAPPVSAATASPYPGIVMCEPSGITDGSTATTPQPTGRPLAVFPCSA